MLVAKLQCQSFSKCYSPNPPLSRVSAPKNVRECSGTNSRPFYFRHFHFITLWLQRLTDYKVSIPIRDVLRFMDLPNMVIDDILPTKERLHRIALADTAHCTNCGQVDTLSHRLIDCGQGRKCGSGQKDSWRRCSVHTPATSLWIGPSAHASDFGPLRSTVLYCGFWPILSITGRKTPLHRPYRTTQISCDEPAGRHTPWPSAAKKSVNTSLSLRRLHHCQDHEPLGHHSAQVAERNPSLHHQPQWEPEIKDDWLAFPFSRQ
jgi:hypothetical protein